MIVKAKSQKNGKTQDKRPKISRKIQRLPCTKLQARHRTSQIPCELVYILKNNDIHYKLILLGHITQKNIANIQLKFQELMIAKEINQHFFQQIYKYKLSVDKFYQMTHNKTFSSVDTPEKEQTNHVISGQQRNAMSQAYNQGNYQPFLNPFDPFNCAYNYPFMQNFHMYPPFPINYYPYQSVYPEMPKCLSPSVMTKIQQNQEGCIKNESQNEEEQMLKMKHYQKVLKKYKKQKKLKTMKRQIQENQFYNKGRPTKLGSQQMPECIDNSSDSPQRIQNEQEFIQVFQQIISVFTEESSAELKKQQWITFFIQNLQSKDQSQKLKIVPKFQELMMILSQKFASLKKTKEEYIKYIIRKIYNNLSNNVQRKTKLEYLRLQQFHLDNLNSFGTMNMQFMRKQFSNPLFLQLYIEFMQNIQVTMKMDNKKRIQRLARLILKVWKENALQKLRKQRKLPWTKSNNIKAIEICFGLIRQHGQSLSDTKHQELQ